MREPYQLPIGSWDSHVHVVDDKRFPFHPDRLYTPKTANIDDLIRFEAGLGIENVCLVAISVYGDDNRSILEALKRLGQRARAVVCIDPDKITQEELKAMHKLGVRGVRLNLKTGKASLSEVKLSQLIHVYARILRPLGWALQIYLSLEQISSIADEIPKLHVPVIIDHLAHPNEDMAPRHQRGYNELLKLLSERIVWIKLSGTYRYERMPGLKEYAKTIINTAPSQVIWASDWPHSGSVEMNPSGNRYIPQDYRKVDDIGFLNQCVELCGHDEELVHMIFVDNPRRLWQIEHD